VATLSTATGFSAKITRFTKKNSLDLKKISRLKVFASKFAVFLEMIYLFTLFPKNLYIICKFVNIDHVEVWKISY